MAEAYVHSEANTKDMEEYYRCIPFAIYKEEKMIGFTMITYEKEYNFDNKPAYEIYRLMIDKNYQGKGYGKEAINLLLRYIQTFLYGKAENIYVEWNPDNKISETIFTTKGFAIVGSDEDGTVIVRRTLISFMQKEIS